jgi:hypothetical protein
VRLLICRKVRLDGENNSQELAPFRVCGGCPGVFGPNPSAGLDECADSNDLHPARASISLAFAGPLVFNAPLY